jgi:hypothetical protein
MASAPNLGVATQRIGRLAGSRSSKAGPSRAIGFSPSGGRSAAGLKNSGKPAASTGLSFAER